MQQNFNRKRNSNESSNENESADVVPQWTVEQHQHINFEQDQDSNNQMPF